MVDAKAACSKRKGGLTKEFLSTYLVKDCESLTKRLKQILGLLSKFGLSEERHPLS